MTELESLKEWGAKLERLGKVIQDPCSTLQQIVNACEGSGLRFGFRVHEQVREEVDLTDE